MSELAAPWSGGRTSLVTGATAGLGLEVARQLIALDHDVIVSGRNPVAVAAAVRIVGSAMPTRQQRLHPLVLDVAAADLGRELDEGLATLASERGQAIAVDVLVNNAGVLRDGGVIDDDGDDAINEAFAVHVLGPRRLCRALVPGMIARGFGRVVNVSSGWGSFGEGLGGPVAYSVTKAALNALTVTLAREVGGAVDVKVNAVCPGWVKTRMGGEGAPREVETGARGITWAATLPPDGPHGGFFRDGAPISW